MMISGLLLFIVTALVPDTVPQVRVSLHFVDTPVEDVVMIFADFAGRSVVFGPQVTGLVNAEILDQPWREALHAILEAHGFAFREGATGILHVDVLHNLIEDRTWAPTEVRVFPVQFGSVEEYEAAIRGQLSMRGSISLGGQGRWVVVRDTPPVLDQIYSLLDALESPPREITISATLLFVNRSRLWELGVSYELMNGTGSASDDSGMVMPGVGLRGPVLAAIGNANQRVSAPSLRLVVDLLMGRHRFLSFAEALESAYLSEVEARPQLRVLEHHTARILVGERVPVPIYRPLALERDPLDMRSPGTPVGVQFQDVGIRLEVTPHVTEGDRIILDIHAERSGVEVVESTLGFVFNTQEASTRMRVRDGETAVLGGLTLREKAELRSGIPVLMHLPLIGRWFRLTRQEMVQRDLIILITPSLHPAASSTGLGHSWSGHLPGGSPP
jgi:type II secretory pathway component GspD/PulD (secretin)